jgi:hypothetical protein
MLKLTIAFLNEIFPRFGLPGELVSNNAAIIHNYCTARKMVAIDATACPVIPLLMVFAVAFSFPKNLSSDYTLLGF